MERIFILILLIILIPGCINESPLNKNFLKYDADYSFRLLFVVLYDDSSKQFLDHDYFGRPLKELEGVFDKESLGKINLTVHIEFLDIKKLGLEHMMTSWLKSILIIFQSIILIYMATFIVFTF